MHGAQELLAERSLPVTGRKDDLVARLLSSSTTSTTGAEASTTLPPPTTDTTGPASSTDGPDGAGLSGTAEVSAAANTETDLRSAEEKDEGLKSAPPPPEVSEDERKALLAAQAKDEEERRRKRAERFGLSAIQGEKGDDSDEAKRKRAERFGLQNAEGEEEGGAQVDKKMGKVRRSLARPLVGRSTRKRDELTLSLSRAHAVPRSPLLCTGLLPHTQTQSRRDFQIRPLDRKVRPTTRWIEEG